LKVVNCQFLALYLGQLPKSHRYNWHYCAESAFLIMGRQIAIVHYYVTIKYLKRKRV